MLSVFQIWTSELCRTVHTVQHIPGQRAHLKDLNEINAVCIQYNNNNNN